MDALAQFFLYFTDAPWLIFFLGCGFLFGDRTLFYHATCIMLISTVLNVALKYTFQIPLAPTLHKAGFAFPSGHMQFATVLYGWFALHTKNHALHITIACLLGGIGFGLVHFHYHTWFDTFGALFFAGIILGAYYMLLTKKPAYFTRIQIATAVLAMSYIAYRGTIPHHAWVAFSLLLSLILIASQKQTPHKYN
ncbi:MAG: hypothetical protein K0U24_02555 [Gammaproteobacteria bacterium]|nr:hypothetical protein [Gammaproteobacteria bacterium]MCH9715985.1 hypothetical protein [Gammaproteobacteria bacterium]MCH9763102.1 hypothetical protein [Gammaproteobacteria bacterium]